MLPGHRLGNNLQYNQVINLPEGRCSPEGTTASPRLASKEGKYNLPEDDALGFEAQDTEDRRQVGEGPGLRASGG